MKHQQNDLIAIIHYAKINSYIGSKISVTDVDSNTKFDIIGKDLHDKLLSADQFSEEKKVTKTEAAELLVNSRNVPFTVCFLKADKTERKLRGRLVSPEPLLGRSHVEDLDVTEKHKLRLVDHREILWIIVSGVKYVVKK